MIPRFQNIIEMHNTCTMPACFIERRNFRAALPSKMPLYPADTYANEYDEDEFVLECAREDGYA